MAQFMPTFENSQPQDLKICETTDEIEDSLVDEACESKLCFVFIVDRSGSMSGSRITQTLEALKLFLQSLPQGCMFQVISFGSRFTYFMNSEQMQPYNDQMLKRILDEISTYGADYGGTNILEPIRSVTSL